MKNISITIILLVFTFAVYQTVGGEERKIESPAIPPIDAAAPSTFETASFGLG